MFFALRSAELRKLCDASVTEWTLPQSAPSHCSVSFWWPKIEFYFSSSLKCRLLFRMVDWSSIISSWPLKHSLTRGHYKSTVDCFTSFRFSCQLSLFVLTSLDFSKNDFKLVMLWTRVNIDISVDIASVTRYQIVFDIIPCSVTAKAGSNR